MLGVNSNWGAVFRGHQLHGRIRQRIRIASDSVVGQKTAFLSRATREDEALTEGRRLNLESCPPWSKESVRSFNLQLNGMVSGATCCSSRYSPYCAATVGSC